MYADDAVFAFSDLTTLEDGAKKLRAHFARWSLTFQVSHNQARGAVEINQSKSVAMHFLGKSCQDETPAEVEAAWRECVGLKIPMEFGDYIALVETFIYLGTLLPVDVSCDDAAVKRNIAKASAAFGALSRHAFKTRGLLFALRAKFTRPSCSRYYCETWIYKTSTWKVLQDFHHRCICTMANVNMAQGHDPTVVDDSGPCSGVSPLPC